MTKTTKQKEAVVSKEKSKKNAVVGLLEAVHAVGQLVAVYVFATQDTPFLWVIAGILGIHSAIKIGQAFTK